MFFFDLWILNGQHVFIQLKGWLYISRWLSPRIESGDRKNSTNRWPIAVLMRWRCPSADFSWCLRSWWRWRSSCCSVAVITHKTVKTYDCQKESCLYAPLLLLKMGSKIEGTSKGSLLILKSLLSRLALSDVLFGRFV